MKVEKAYQLITSDSARSWIEKFPFPDAHSFLLNPPAEVKEISKLIVDQWEARKKAIKKLPVLSQETGILFPPPLSIEQASSEITAKYKSQMISGHKLTDLTGGSGIDCLFFSEVFSHIEYIEQNAWLCKVYEHNLQCLGKANIDVIHTTAEEHLQHLEEKQWVYIDPARRDTGNKKVFKIEECSPNLQDIIPIARSKNCQIMIKLSPLIDIKSLTEDLSPGRIYIVGVNHEVKEIIAILQPKAAESPTIHAVDIVADQVLDFTFRPKEESEATFEFSDPKKYLYDPNPSILKAGAFRLLAQRYALNKVAINTHLYTSDQLIQDFPGRVFEIVDHLTGSLLKKMKGKSLHVISKNHPSKAKELTKKYGLKETGDHYLVAYSNHQNKKKMILTKRIKIDQIAS